MPELPEMENYKRLLNQKISGQIITNVDVTREKSINVKTDLLKKTIQNQRVRNIGRRGKQLLFYLENDQVLLLHLMLGGWMFYGRENDKPNRTIQVRLSFGEEHLYFIGLRLGYLHLLNQQSVQEQLSHLGPEALSVELTQENFLKLIKGKHGRLKTKIIDQEFIAGIGNCYSDEICFHAGVLPIKNIQEMKAAELERFYHSLQHVLNEAIQFGGYMANPLYNGDTLTGGYDEKCQVYDREGEPCSRCGTPISKQMISSRKTFYCSNCQK